MENKVYYLEFYNNRPTSPFGRTKNIAMYDRPTSFNHAATQHKGSWYYTVAVLKIKLKQAL